jgi:NADPH-dependent glutamate synthase beta subunit-like oxidoreductase
VAIIGAGPAGLAAAYELAKLGYPVTVFERMSNPGGMMRYGIPDHRLKKYVVANEIAFIQDLGVEIKTGSALGKDFTLEELQELGYKAIFIAVGAQRSQLLGVPGEHLGNVFPAVEFLRDIAQGRTFDVGEKVAIVGGGNSAVDAARVSLRLEAREVIILYRRSRKEMPALSYEVEAAQREGVKLQFLVSPKRILGEKGSVKAIECVRMKLGPPDESGRRRPIPIPDSEHTYEIDTVIPAIGQKIETHCLPPVLVDGKARGISTDPLTLETKLPGVFAGGDLVTGPASVIEAVAAGKGAAISIDRYLNNSNLKADRHIAVEETTWVKNWKAVTKKSERYVSFHEDLGRYKVSFEEADELMAKNKEIAVSEARRCMECGPCIECLGDEGLCDADKAVIDESLCTGCNVCAVVCPFGGVEKNEIGVAKINEFLCKGCGICSASCPERAVSMKKSSEDQIVNMISAALEGS